MLLNYFSKGTERTVTGSRIGMEIETDLVMEDGSPISERTSRTIINRSFSAPQFCRVQLELGRQKIEVAIEPQPTAERVIELARMALQWLYKVAAQCGARPVFAPEINWQGQLLFVQEKRDDIWVQLDGRPALEELCRCSSVQFTVDVNPADAISIINRLYLSRLQLLDYEPNHRRWVNYIAASSACYSPDRYGGPTHFGDLADYAAKLEEYPVVMHRGRPIRAYLGDLRQPNIDLFLRSVWWHHRLRRFGGTLALEIRPLARRSDEQFEGQWEAVVNAAGL